MPNEQLHTQKPPLSSMILLACLGLFLTTVAVWTVDPALTNWLGQHPAPQALDNSVQILCLFFTTHLWTLIAFIMSIVVSVWAYRDQLTTPAKQKIATFFITFFILFIVATLLKIAIGRARPFMLVQEHISGFFPFMHQYNYYSMPSGHITTATYLCCGIFLWTRSSLLRVLAVIVAALIIIARIILLKHFIGDVLFTITLALLFFSYRHVIAQPWLKFVERLAQQINNPGQR